jgi:hypothetical protein
MCRFSQIMGLRTQGRRNPSSDEPCPDGRTRFPSGRYPGAGPSLDSFGFEGVTP